ncbi:MAG: hypothetical protein JEZ02_20770 [Desulfatibacillum sp.]|nr:hypothetical protein [Desulfatibacillum sp.]
MGEPKNIFLKLSQPEPGISIPGSGFVFGAGKFFFNVRDRKARNTSGQHRPNSFLRKNSLAGLRIFARKPRLKQTRIKTAARFIRAYSQVLSGIPDFQSRSRIHLYMIQAMANSLDTQAREDFLNLARRMAHDLLNGRERLASNPLGLRDPGPDTITPKGKDAPCS